MPASASAASRAIAWNRRERVLIGCVEPSPLIRHYLSHDNSLALLLLSPPPPNPELGQNSADRIEIGTLQPITAQESSP